MTNNFMMTASRVLLSAGKSSFPFRQRSPKFDGQRSASAEQDRNRDPVFSYRCGLAQHLIAEMLWKVFGGEHVDGGRRGRFEFDLDRSKIE